MQGITCETKNTIVRASKVSSSYPALQELSGQTATTTELATLILGSLGGFVLLLSRFACDEECHTLEKKMKIAASGGLKYPGGCSKPAWRFQGVGLDIQQ